MDADAQVHVSSQTADYSGSDSGHRGEKGLHLDQAQKGNSFSNFAK